MDARNAGMRWGIAATILGLAGLAAILYAPVHPATINGSSGYRTSLVNPLADPRALPQFVVVPIALGIVLLVLIGLGAIMQAQVRWNMRIVGQVVLWVATAGLLVFMLFAGLSLSQLFLLPALAAALCASVFAVRTRDIGGLAP